MSLDAFEICVLGVGHLAAAVRVQLALFGVAPAAGDDDIGGSVHRVVLACSDCECTSSFADANRRAIDEGARILFARISRGRVEIGPLVVPLESPCFECQPTRRWDFSLSETSCFTGAMQSAPLRATLNPDTRLKSVAHFGALLLAREICAHRLIAPGARLVGRVAKFDPPWSDPQIEELVRSPDCPACGRRGR